VAEQTAAQPFCGPDRQDAFDFRVRDSFVKSIGWKATRFCAGIDDDTHPFTPRLRNANPMPAVEPLMKAVYFEF